MSRRSNSTMPIPSTPRKISIARVNPLSERRGEVDLRHVARDDEFGIASHARKEHLDLRQGRILRLVQNDESVVERTAAHISQRRDLHGPLLDVFLQLGGRNHIVERIVQRLQIGIELLLHVARQETQLLARFDGRTRQDDPLDVFFFQARTARAMAV